MFAKLAREITVAAKIGMPDPDMNPRLRLAIQAARAENMPKDNIERAIKKAAGGDAETYEAIRYEGYGPGGVAVIVEALTDNRNRTGGAVRAVFTKYGGNLGATGSVSHMFAHVGEIAYPGGRRLGRRGAGGGHRCRRRRRRIRRRRPRHHLRLREPRHGGRRARGQARRAADASRRSGSRTCRRRSTRKTPQSILKLIAALEDDDDVQNVYANFEVSDDVLKKLTAA